MTTKVNKAFKLKLTNVNKITNEAIKPDTIVNIQNKLGLVFPFQVKRVKCSGIGIGNMGKGAIITVTGYKRLEIGALVVENISIPHKNRMQHLGANNFKDFIHYEVN